MSAAPVETPAPASTPTDSGFPALTGVSNTPAAQPAAPPAPAWTEGLSADDKAFLSSKGWDKEGKGVGDIIKGYRHAERLRGVEVDKLVRVPDWNKPEEVAEYRKRIGVPETHEAYESHEVMTQTGILDPAVLTPISHELGLTQQQHAAFLDATGRVIGELFQTEADDKGRRNAAELVELKREWGTQFDVNNQNVDRAIAQLKLKDDFVDALKNSAGEAGTRRFLADLGVRLGEHRRPGNETPASVLMTSDVAKARMSQIKGDAAWMASHAMGDVDKRREWMELQQIAFGD